MSNDTIISFSDPAFHDELTELVRGGARRMLCEALIADVETFCAQYAVETDDQGRRAVVRNGYLPEREILTGIGPVAVRVPKTRDRAGEGRCFRSELLPPYLKKTRRLEAVIPWLYLKGVSTNDFDEALTDFVRPVGEGVVSDHHQSAQAGLGAPVCGFSPPRLARP